MASLVYDEVGPLVKSFVTSLVGAHIEGALPLGDLVAGQDALAGQHVNLVLIALTLA